MVWNRLQTAYSCRTVTHCADTTCEHRGTRWQPTLGDRLHDYKDQGSLLEPCGFLYPAAPFTTPWQLQQAMALKCSWFPRRLLHWCFMHWCFIPEAKDPPPSYILPCWSCFTWLHVHLSSWCTNAVPASNSLALHWCIMPTLRESINPVGSPWFMNVAVVSYSPVLHSCIMPTKGIVHWSTMLPLKGL